MIWLLVMPLLAAPPREPLPISVPDDILSEMSAEERAVIAQIESLAQAKLTHYPRYPLTLPVSDVPAVTGSLFDLDALSPLPMGAVTEELQALAWDDAADRRRRFTPAQRAEIRRTGSFTVDSPMSPDHPHVWALTGGLQKGTAPTGEDFRADTSIALERLTVHARRRLVEDNGFSVPGGAQDTGRAARGVVSQLVGLPARSDVYGAQDIGEQLDDALREQQRAASAADPGDPRGLDPEGVAALEPHLREAEQAARDAWDAVAAAQQVAWWDAALAAGLSEADAERTVGEQSSAAYADLLAEILEGAVALDALRPGLAAGTAAYVRAEDIRARADRERLAEIGAERARLSAALEAEHPTRARSSVWLAERTEASLADWTAAQAPRWRQERVEAVRAAGLPREAAQEVRRQRFWDEQAPALRDTLEQQLRRGEGLEPARTFTWERQLWQPVQGYTLDEDGEEVAELRHAVRVQRDTGAALWRLRVAGVRTGVWTNNVLRWGLVSSTWNGRFGLRAQLGDLWGQQPFHQHTYTDTRSGERLGAPGDAPIKTYGQRLRVVWVRARASRAAFEERADDRFIPKDVARFFHATWSYGLRAPLETVAIGVGQPVLTVGSVGVSTGLAVTSVAWVPALNGAIYVSDLALIDFDSPGWSREQGNHPRLLPLPWLVVARLGVGGVGQVAGAGVWGALGEPLLGGTIALGASGRAGVRLGYDTLMYGAVVRPLGRVPASESSLAWREAGPGVARPSLAQIDPGLAVLALRAKLESIELEAFRRHHTEQITAPVEEYRAFLARLLSPFLTDAAPSDPTLVRTTQAHLHSLDTAVDAQQARLSALLEQPLSDVIRQTDAQLAQTRAWGAVMVEAFFTERAAEHLRADQQAAIFSAHGLSPGDWAGLSDALLVELFSPSFLRPLDALDEAVVVSVTQPALSAYLSDLLSGRPTALHRERQIALRFADSDGTEPAVPTIASGELLAGLREFSSPAAQWP